MSVIVTNASSVKALVITRSLSRRGISVIATDSERFSPTFYSKYCTKHFLIPSCEKNPMNFISSILNFVKKENVEVLFPINSAETLLISQHKEKFDPYTKIPFQEYSKLEQVHDKLNLMKIAKNLDIPIPETFEVKRIEDLHKIAININYPAVIKLRNATSSVGVSYAKSKEELITSFKNTVRKFGKSENSYPIVQEYIPGVSYGVSLLFNEGDLRAKFVHQRLREFPISGGPSTFRISVKEPEMEKIAIDLLQSLNWHGIAMVEFKKDSRTNKPVLIEVNPRFWGSIYQAIASGVDFPYLLYKMVTEGDVKPILNYKTGVKTRFFMNDVRSILSQIKNKKDLSMLKELFNFYEEDLYYDVLSFDDPKPSIAFLYMGLKEIFFSKYR